MIDDSRMTTTDDDDGSLPDSTTSPSVLYDSSKPYFPIYYNDVYEVILPKGHRFPMEKYRKVRTQIQQLIAEHTKNILDDRDAGVDNEFRVSPLATVAELTTTHSPEYIHRFLSGDQTESEQRNVGFPWSPSGVSRALSSVGGTVAAATAVCEALVVQQQEQLNEKQEHVLPIWSAHVAGGTHHAFYDYGEGFCVFSDIAVAANVILQNYPTLIQRVLIVDLDVHQGNGNAVLFQGRQDVSTFSMHCSANYFSPKEESDLDVELPVDCTDDTYLVTLRHWLKRIGEEADNFDIVFFQAGVDILEEDRLGRFNLSHKGIERRNELVFDFAAKQQKVPLVITMGGGYPKNGTDWKPIIDAHANVYYQAYRYLSRFKS